MKQRAIGLLSFILLGISFTSPSFAQKTYTPTQLRSMVQSGRPPRQGSPSSQSERMDYATCIGKITSVISSVQPNYPTSTILSTNTARIEKVWTNDSAMTLTCSALDGKVTITSAPYL